MSEQVKPLKIETHFHGFGSKTMKVSGFTESELSELTSMEYREMIDTVLDILDRRNGNIGTCWHNGYGVLNMWVNAGCVYVEIGASAD